MSPKILVRDNCIFNAWEKQRETPYFTWVMDETLWDGNIAVFSDSFLIQAINHPARIKVAWLLEPPVITGHIYDWIVKNHSVFDMVFTFKDDLLTLDPKFRYWPMGSTWISEPNRKIYPKSKNVSIIASHKRYAPGHILRHQFIARHRMHLDVMGKGYRPITDKLEGLKDYRYSVAIENCRLESYFTEKLLDCFMTGTVPVYWGCPSIDRFFDVRGMVLLDSPDTFNIESLNEVDYNRLKPYIEKNFETAKRYIDLEKNLWENGLKDL